MRNKNLAYSEVRDWWLYQGNYMYRKAMALKKETELVKSKSLSVLCFLEEGHPMWLTYDEAHKPTLCATPEKAHRFPITSVAELSPESLLKAADEFEFVLTYVGATSVKVIPQNQSSS